MNALDINTTDPLELILLLLCWAILIVVVYNFYKQKKEQLSIWLVILITVIGMFSFDFIFPISGHEAALPVLPLGVGILYAILRFRNSLNTWKQYRLFAWIGFFINFLFFLATLISGLI